MGRLNRVVANVAKTPRRKLLRIASRYTGLLTISLKNTRSSFPSTTSALTKAYQRG